MTFRTLTTLAALLLAAQGTPVLAAQDDAPQELRPGDAGKQAQKELDKIAERRADSAFKERLLTRLQDEAKEASSTLSKASKEVAAYRAELAEMLKSDTGRRIGADADSLRVFRDQYHSTIATPEQLEAAKLQADMVAAGLQEELGKKLTFREPSALEREGVLQLSMLGRTSMEAASAGLLRLKGLGAKFAAETTGASDASAPTLQVALEEYEAQMATGGTGVAASVESWAVAFANVRRTLETAEARRQAAEHQLQMLKIESEMARGREEGQQKARQQLLEQELKENQAEVDRQVKASDSELERKVARLEQDLKDKDAALAAEVNRQVQMRIADRKEDAAALRADLDAKDAEIRRIKAESGAKIAEAEKKVRQLESKLALRELPAEVKQRVRLVASSGYWKPVLNGAANGKQLDPDARYDSIDPVPYRLADLAACGALDSGDGGIYALYVIMANRHNDRGPMTPQWHIGYGNGHYPGWDGIDYKKEFTKSNESRELYETMKSLNAYLREWGDELVREGVLR